MIDSQNNISSQTARQILLDAKKSGVAVEVYLKNLADEQSENQNSENYHKRPAIGKSSINYNFPKSHEWLKNNAQRYMGKWIVLDGENLIGAGENPVPIVEKARRKGVKIPFVLFIENNSKPFMGGWI